MNEASEARKALPKRAAQACVRCRKQKLRCLGGWPCKRCTESGRTCDFGPQGFRASATANGPTSDPTARLAQLESSVANLLAGLSGGQPMPTGNPPRRELVLPPTDPQASVYVGSSARPPPNAHASPHIVTPNSVSPLANFQLAQDHHPTGPSPDHRQQVRFIGTPNNIVTEISPRHTESEGSREVRPKKGKNQKAEDRLALATEESYEAPFRPLVYQPSIWENREPSRRNSPERTASIPSSRDELSWGGAYDRQTRKDKDDPVNSGILDLATAEKLFEFFMLHCHPFLPIIDITPDDAFTPVRQSPPLFSAVSAIAARFYNKFAPRSASAPLEPSIPYKLANLAEFHLAQTLLRKNHTLADSQASLLLAAWCLRGSGGGPDAWIVTGHAARIARRLGVHTALARATESAKAAQPGSEEWTSLEKFMPQWRTWLCWFGYDGLFSLGFGRPQTGLLESFGEAGFLRIKVNQPLPRPGSKRSIALHGDLYIAGQVQLTQIGRDLIRWREILANPTETKTEDSPISMLRDLNARLDDWCRLWVWSGSPYAIYLGSSVRNARLLAEHMRLCLNAYALRSAPEGDPFIADCLRKAFNAAVATIETHYESRQSDMALSFVTDYIIITIAQAALFLIRMTKAPQAVRALVLEADVITHYLHMALDALEGGDISEIRLASYLAKTIRDIARVAGVSGLGGEESRPSSSGGVQDFSFEVNPAVPPVDFENIGPARDFDMDGFLQLEPHLDLGYLLGLSADGNDFMANMPAQPFAFGDGSFVQPGPVWNAPWAPREDQFQQQ